MTDEQRRDVRGPSTSVVFTCGLVVGAGLGVLFAPRPGHESRRRIVESAEALRGRTSDTLQHSQEQLSHMVDRGRDVYQRARELAKPRGEHTEEECRDAGRDASEAAESL